MKLLHLVNPVKVAKNHELRTAQPITFESLKNAQNYSSSFFNEVVLASTQFSEDKEIIPEYILQLSNLERSVNDCNENLNSRKLPLINDILKKSIEVADADYIIYTNIDIGVMPFFYEFIFQEIEKGHDAIIINRRRVSANFKKVEDLAEIYSQLGKSHPGFDCFIFKAEFIDKLILDKICIGVPFAGVSLLHNLIALSKNPKILTDSHLTFHIGMNVLGFKKDAYYEHNKAIFFNKIRPELKSKYNLDKFPYAQKSQLRRAINWVLNPSLFTTDYLDLSSKSFMQRIKLKIDEIRWGFLQH